MRMMQIAYFLLGKLSSFLFDAKGYDDVVSISINWVSTGTSSALLAKLGAIH